MHNQFIESLEYSYDKWVKKEFPGVGDGGNVMEDSKTIYSILLPLLKEGIKIAEIGVWTGKTSTVLGSMVKTFNGKVYSVDHFEGQSKRELVGQHPNLNDPKLFSKWTGEWDICSVWKANIKHTELEGYVTLKRMSSLEGSKEFEDEYFDFIYLDASHDYDSVKEDLEVWYPKLKPGGTIAGHDFEEKMSIGGATALWKKYKEEFFNCKCHPGVILAVVEKFPNVKHIPKRTWYVRKE